MRCKKCNNSNIRTRRNYSHGSKSRSTTIMFCKTCGSTSIESGRNDNKKRRWKKR